ncbi:MAG: hypothetical protein R2741_12570 [Methanolobus sp.]
MPVASSAILMAVAIDMMPPIKNDRTAAEPAEEIAIPGKIKNSGTNHRASANGKGLKETQTASKAFFGSDYSHDTPDMNCAMIYTIFRYLPVKDVCNFLCSVPSQ